MKKANSDTTCLIYDLTKQAERFQTMAREAKQETKREFECSYELKKENAELCRINTELRKDFNEAIAQRVICVFSPPPSAPKLDAKRFAAEAGISEQEAERVLEDALAEKKRIDEMNEKQQR